MDDQTQRAANQILIRFITDIEAKLEYGAKQRQAFAEALMRGERPQNDRADFMIKSGSELIRWMAAKAEEFNARFPQDRMSTDDMIDLLMACIEAIEKKTKTSR